MCLLHTFLIGQSLCQVLFYGNFVKNDDAFVGFFFWKAVKKSGYRVKWRQAFGAKK